VDGAPVVRRDGFIPPRDVTTLLADAGSLDLAALLKLLPPSMGSATKPEVSRLALGPGEGASPLLPDGARAGFLLDLEAPDWRSEWGGLLLFRADHGRVSGYRPIPGALTLFEASTAPFISLATMEAPRRISLLGWWA